MTNYSKRSKFVSISVVLTMFMTVFAIPAMISDDVFAATKADSSKNKIQTNGKVIAGKTHTISAVGDRQTALNAPSVETGDTFYIPLVWAVYTTAGKNVKAGEFINEAKLDQITNNGMFPNKFDSKLKINKPGKYRLGAGFLRLQWDGKDFKEFNSNTDISTKIRTITVYGTVKFKANGKKVKKLSKKSKLVKNKGKYGKLPKPTRKGYKFKGWYTKKKGGKKITAKSKVSMSKSTKTLYAQWKKK